MTRIALPPMRGAGYAEGPAAATIAVGGTLGILIPPSVALAVYGILTEQDISRLFVAGIIPGAMAVVMHMAIIHFIARRNPDLMPRSERYSWRERAKAYVLVWPVALIFIFVLGGMYFGLFTPSEAAAMGAIFTVLLGLFRRHLRPGEIWGALVETCQTSAAIFVILIGAVVFGYFLAITGAPYEIASWIGGLPLPPLAILAVILALYLVLGCVLDSLAMIVLTVPDHLSHHPASGLRSDLVRGSDGDHDRARSHYAADRTECLRDQKHGDEPETGSGVQGNHTVHRNGHLPPGAARGLSDPRPLASQFYGLTLWGTVGDFVYRCFQE